MLGHFAGQTWIGTEVYDSNLALVLELILTGQMAYPDVRKQQCYLTNTLIIPESWIAPR
jgi:hypothetical protein